jgi:hypothetical protein
MPVGSNNDIVGNFKTCEANSLAKARQIYAKKDWKGGSVTAGETL